MALAASACARTMSMMNGSGGEQAATGVASGDELNKQKLLVTSKHAFAYISKGLQHDERVAAPSSEAAHGSAHYYAGVREAVLAYQTGLMLMREAMDIPIIEHDEETRALHARMRRNLESLTSRVEELKLELRQAATAQRDAAAAAAAAAAPTPATAAATAATKNAVPPPPPTSDVVDAKLRARTQELREMALKELKHVDKKFQQAILSGILEDGPSVSWDDIVGQERAKQLLKEAVIYPLLRNDVYTGLRQPNRGVLLYGPPGTGKTMLARALAHESKATFFNITPSALTSKYVGESEKLVKTLFLIARTLQPSVVFIDEIDSILSTRSDKDLESSIRMKDEFLVMMEGVGSTGEDQVVIMGATNRFEHIDDAAKRRLATHIEIPLPDARGRSMLITKLLGGERHKLSRRDIEDVAARTDGFSFSGLKTLCKDAALSPVRELGAGVINVRVADIRPIEKRDFLSALAYATRI